MKRQTKKTMWLISFGILLYAAVMNLRTVLFFLRSIGVLVFPILLGFLFAFVLNVPMKGFENLITRLFSKAKRKPGGNVRRGFSLVLTLLCIVLVITLAFTLVIPELVKSARSIYPLVQVQWPRWLAYLEGYSIDLTALSEWAESFDWKQLFAGAGSLFGSAMSFASSTVSGVVSTVFAMVISIYILLSKQVLAGQVKKLMVANLPAQTVEKFCAVGTLARDTYAKFLSGQCVEAILLGSLIFVAYSVFRLPYAGLVAFLTGLFAFVPYVGAFAACFVGTFLTLLAAPSKVLLGILVYLVVQFVENQFIYPHVVGTSVGLSPLWTLVAALIGGKLLGLAGIIFFIPLVAVLYQLVRDNTYRKLAERGCPPTGFAETD